MGFGVAGGWYQGVSCVKDEMVPSDALGACGAIEAWLTIEMMREGWIAPTLNLETVDPRCGSLDYIRGTIREINAEYVMSNNFAFGGVNTSLIFRRWPEP